MSFTPGRLPAAGRGRRGARAVARRGDLGHPRRRRRPGAGRAHDPGELDARPARVRPGALRRPRARAGRTRGRAARSSTARSTTSSTPASRASRRAPCARARSTRASTSSAPCFFESAGWERPQWYEANADLRRRSRSGALGVGGALLVADRRRRASGVPRAASGLFDLTPFTKLEVSGPGALGYLQRLAANERRSRRSGRSSTRRCSRRAAGSCATSRSRACADDALPASSPAARSASTTSPGCAATCPATARCTLEDRPRASAASGVWGPRRTRSRRLDQRGRPLQRGLPVHDDARASHRLRAGAGAADLLRRRAGLGDLRADRVRRSRCGTRSGRPGAPFGAVACGGGAYDSLRLEKGYRLWGAGHRRGARPLRGRPGLRREAEQGRLPRPRGGRPREGGRAPAAGCAAWFSTTRSVVWWARSRSSTATGRSAT